MTDKYFSDMPKMIQESKFQHSRALNLNQAKRAAKQRLSRDRCDAAGFNVKDAGTAENRLLNQFRYNPIENLIDIIRKHARANPHHTIAITPDSTLTYKELEEKSNALALYLLKKGINKGNLVGLCSLLTTDFIICLLGILKAGAVYFPLDPEFSNEDLQYRLDDGKPFAILVEPQFKYRFTTLNNIIEIEKNIYSAKEQTFHSQSHQVYADDIAYVIYTSGSTGHPKGIMVTHKSLSHIALAHQLYYPSNIKMLVSGGVCFDASLLVIIHALSNNESLYLFNYHSSDSVDSVIHFIEKNSINYIICVPSFYLKLLNGRRIFNSLKCVSLTGENLTKHLCNLHVTFAPNALLYNEYGPSEYAIGTTIEKIYDPKLKILGDINVGKPLPNTQVYILDKQLNQVPHGSKGEICIAGSGLAKGYLNKETLTKEKFIKVNLENKNEKCLYRTGDLGSFLPNGKLEFLGRISDTSLDNSELQIGEIEYHIAQCPAIEEAAVLVKKDSHDNQYLVAYITSACESAKTSLLQFLKGRIPNHMLPLIIHIKKFPFSSNGKIDREKLISYE